MAKGFVAKIVQGMALLIPAEKNPLRPPNIMRL
jgi:hypothetical protein